MIIKQYKLDLPEGFGIIGKFYTEEGTIGFYVKWMIPKLWTLSTNIWFPDDFKELIKTFLLVQKRLEKNRSVGIDFSLPPLPLKPCFIIFKQIFESRFDINESKDILIGKFSMK